MEQNIVEVKYESGIVGLVAKHGPISVTMSFSALQARTLASVLLGAAKACEESTAKSEPTN